MAKRIDIHTHFAPLKFLNFAEEFEGKASAVSGLYRRKPRLTDPIARLELMDANYIDIHVLVPVPWLDGFPRIASDPETATKAARLMNDELAAVVATAPGRFRGVAMLPTVDGNAAAAELERTVKELGFIGAYVPVGPTAKRMDHPEYEILYEATVELDVSLWLHPSRPPIPSYIDEDQSKYLEWHAVGWPSDTTSAMYRIVFSGVFQRFPSIRILTHHHGGLIPYLAPRIEAAWAVFEQARLAPPTELPKPLIDHFKKFFCDTATLGFAPKSLELACEFFGPERILFGSDCPFDVNDGEASIHESLRSIEAMQVGESVRSAILENNAQAILKFPRGVPEI